MRVLLIGDACEAASIADSLPGCSLELSPTNALNDLPANRFYGLVVCPWSGGREQGLLELLQRWKSRAHLLVAFTEQDSAQIQARALELGFDDVVLRNDSYQLLPKFRLAQRLHGLSEKREHAQKLESIGKLASGIAHEINTPIQYVGDNTRFFRTACQDLADVIRAFQSFLMVEASSHSVETSLAQLAEAMRKAEVDYLLNEVPSAIDQTLEGIDRVATIVRAMKAFAHPGPAKMVRVDLQQTIQTTITVARNEWKYVADLETSFEPNLPSVPCLPGQLSQVLLNLIVNAAHAVAEKCRSDASYRGTIAITTAQRDDMAVIQISDTGAGIAEENLERIFSPVFTTKASGKGTGQGLAIAHSVIVDKHDGSLAVRSRVGEGTTFTIQLPLVVDEALLESEIVESTSA